MEDDIKEMYQKARAAFKTVEYWPQEKVDEMVLAVGWELQKKETAEELARLAVEKSGIGVYEDKVAQDRDEGARDALRPDRGEDLRSRGGGQGEGDPEVRQADRRHRERRPLYEPGVDGLLHRAFPP